MLNLTRGPRARMVSLMRPNSFASEASDKLNTVKMDNHIMGNKLMFTSCTLTTPDVTLKAPYNTRITT